MEEDNTDGASMTYGEEKKRILNFGGAPERKGQSGGGGAPWRREGGNTKT